MAGVVPVAGAPRALARWERGTDLAFRWLLPIAALGSSGLGIALLLDPLAPAGLRGTIAFFLVGWGAAAGVVTLLVSNTHADAAPSRPKRSPTSGYALPPPHVGRVRPSLGDRMTSSLAHPGSEWRVVSLPPNPGDETWISWLPRETRTLDPRPTRGARAPAYSASRPGSMVAVPNRAEFRPVRATRAPADLPHPPLLVQPIPRPQEPRRSRSSPEAPADPFGTRYRVPRRRSPYSEEELDRLFPPSPGGHTTFLTGVPDRIGRAGSSAEPTRPLDVPPDPPAQEVPSRESPPPLAARPDTAPVERIPATPKIVGAQVAGWELGVPAGQVGSRAPGGLLSADDELLLEAANPIPPHLRGPGHLVRLETRRSRRGPVDPSVRKSVCASCSKVVVNLRMSGPCPKCLRPICAECLREALVTRGQGRCVDCSTAPAIGAS